MVIKDDMSKCSLAAAVNQDNFYDPSSRPNYNHCRGYALITIAAISGKRQYRSV